jgi:hypothetical protein
VQVEYVLQLLKPIIDGKAKSFEVTAAATDEYNDWVQSRLRTMAWNGCSSWYRLSGSGKNVLMFPGPVSLFWCMMHTPRWAHFITVGAERWEAERRSRALCIWAAALLVPLVAALVRVVPAW